MVLPVKKSLAVIAPQQPRLPSAPREYDPAYQDQFTDILRLYFNQLQNFNQLIVGPTGGSYLQFPNGAFHDSTTQTQSLANTAKAITFNATDNSNAITIGTPTSRIITSISGYYNFQFSAQLDKTSGGASSVWIWAKVNGVNIPNSTGKIAIQSTTSETVPAWNFVLPMQADDYFELYWMTDDTNTQLKADVAFGTAPNDVPAIPSVILTATFVSALFS
jgi:hypothetical protein